MLEQGQNQPDFEQGDGRMNAKIESKLIRNQKIAVSALVIFGLFTFILWAGQLRSSIKSPFMDYQGDGADIIGSSTDDIDLTKDTDGDGLVDALELGTYKTSPYLTDSDSDGIPDGKEVSDNTDPNCPEGRNCFGVTADIESADSQDTSKMVIPTSTIDALNINSNDIIASSATEKELSNLMSGNVSASELRQMLEQSGMDKKMLDGISDELLMSTFKDTLKSTK